MTTSKEKTLPVNAATDDISRGWVLGPGEKPPTILYSETTDEGLVIHRVSSENEPSEIIMLHSPKQ